MGLFTPPVVSFAEVDLLCEAIVSKATGFKPDYIVSIESGGWYPGDRIARQLRIEHLQITIRRDLGNLGRLYGFFPVGLKWLPKIWQGILFLVTRPAILQKLKPDDENRLAGKKILIVDDTVQSGRTLRLAEAYLQALGGNTQSAVLTRVWKSSRADHSCLQGIYAYPWSRNSPEYAVFQERVLMR